MGSCSTARRHVLGIVNSTESRISAGNTRVISQDALEHFRNAMSERKDDPYSVLLRRNKLPMSLLDDSHVGQKVPLNASAPVRVE